MMPVDVGARGRKYQYTFGTSRIQPTVEKAMKDESLGSVQTHLTGPQVLTSPIYKKMIKDGTSVRLSSSIGRPIVPKMELGFIWMFMVNLDFFIIIVLKLRDI